MLFWCRYAAAQEVSTTPFSSWLALRVGQSSSSSKLKNSKVGRSSTPRGFLTGPGSALARNPPPTSLISDDSEEELMSRGSRSRKNNNSGSMHGRSGNVGKEGMQLPEDLEEEEEEEGGRRFDQRLLQNMCPPSARQTFGLPDATPDAISKFVEVRGIEGERGRAAKEAHASSSNRSSNSTTTSASSSSSSSGSSGLVSASNSRTDVVSSSSTVVSVSTLDGSSNQRLSRSLIMENKPVKVNADRKSGFGNGSNAGSTDGGASASTAAVSEEVEREEAQMVQQQLIEEHAALESQRAAGDLDAVLMTEEKMRAVAEVMSMFRYVVYHIRNYRRRGK